MTLIERIEEGRRRRCSAICYNAKNPHCTCICGGLNHGKGFEEAYEQTWKRMTDEKQREIQN